MPVAEDLRSFLDFAATPPVGADAVLLKRPETVTEDEMLSLIRRDDYDRNRTLGDAVRRWHVAFYGDGPVPRDATGRQIDAPPMRPFPPHATPPVAADGGDLADGVRRIAETVARAAAPGLTDGVRRLQQSLNTEALARPADSTAPLKEDGVFGPATRLRLQQEVARSGVRALRDSLLRTPG